METIIYIADLVTLAIVLYYSYRNDKLKSCIEEEGPFKILVSHGEEIDKVSRLGRST